MSGVKSQGTELFLVDRSGSPAALVKMKAPTGITGLGGAADQIETTDLDAEEDKTFVRGLGNPGQVSAPFVLDPTHASHQLLFDLKASGELVDWIVCLSEAATDPTISSGSIVPPVDRTSFEFQAYVADVNIDIATNEVVRGTLTLQRSGAVTPNWIA